MHFSAFALVSSVVIYGVLALPAPQLAASNDHASDLLVKLNTTYTLLEHYSNITRRSTEPETPEPEIFVSKLVEIKDILRGGTDAIANASLEKRQGSEPAPDEVKNCHIKCETTRGSPKAADVLNAATDIYWADNVGWEGYQGVSGASDPSSTEEVFCSALWPTQYTEGTGVVGTAATGACATGTTPYYNSNVAWLIQQIAYQCSWNELAGGYAECSNPTGFIRFMAFHS